MGHGSSCTLPLDEEEAEAEAESEAEAAAGAGVGETLAPPLAIHPDVQGTSGPEP